MSKFTPSQTLDSLFLPDTPSQVKEKYYTLVERSKDLDFRMLEDGVVVLDTETTGLSFRRCSLIEIAAVKIKGTEIIERFQTYVSPTEPIPDEISKLTGISNRDVEGAPSQEEAVAQLTDFVAGAPVLAHNATFDKTFIEKVKGGHQVSNTWIDTLALSRIAFPCLNSHKLSLLAEAFGCSSVSHRAMADVEALAGVWHIMLTALLDLPEGMLATFADMHPSYEWQYRPIFSYMADATNDIDHCDLVAARRELFSASTRTKRTDAADKSANLQAVSHDEIMHDFSADGLVSGMYHAYETRPEQQLMSQEVATALSTSTHRVIEAGTGVGKSLAYLLPAVKFAQANNVTVGIATKTNTLTDQLLSHELPALAKQLPQGIEFLSLKGYDHYPCLHKVEEALTQELPEPAASYTNKNTAQAYEDMLTALAVTMAYAAQVPYGDLDSLGIRWRSVPRQLLTTTSDECLRSRCPFYQRQCFVHGTRKNADTCDVVVTNHSLLLRNIEADGQVLPPIRHWIVDEAHSFEAEARKQWAREVSAREVRSLFERLGNAKHGAISTLMNQAEGLVSGSLIVLLLSKASSEASRVQVLTASLFDAIRELKRYMTHSSGYDATTLWINDEIRATDEWAELLGVCDDLLPALDDCCMHLKEAVKLVQSNMEHAEANLAPELRGLIALSENIKLITSGADKSYVYSAQIMQGRMGIGSELLSAEKLDIGSELHSRWLSEMMSVVFTSATVAVGDDFSHFNHAVGLDLMGKNSYAGLRMNSSFDFDHNMSAIVLQDLPAPGERGYVDELANMLFDVHVAMGGSTLTLFTNRREMEAVYQVLRPRLAETGLDLVMQERSQTARQVRDAFLAHRQTSLLALKSFWEGFDAVGNTLRCVVIPRLPFSAPTDPLSQERDLREQRAWWKYALPEAVISVKQAAGRLIRSSTDIGVLVMADSRLVSKRYGKQFLKSLPTTQQVFLDAAEVGPFIERWRQEHEDAR